jgi:hypothetical protein
MTTDDITYEQKMRIQRALLKEKRKIDNNKVVAVAIAVICTVLVFI